MVNPVIRVVLIEDQGSIADSYQFSLENYPDLEFVGCAADGPSGLALIKEEQPDVALVDLRLDGNYDGADLIQLVRQQGWHTKLLAVTSHISDPIAGRAIAAGADGLLSRSPRIWTLVNAIKLVHEGVFVMGPVDELGEWYGGINVRAESSPCPLTARQLEVLELIALGLTNDQISERLVVAEGTVRSHVSNAYRASAGHRSIAGVLLRSLSEWE